MTTPEQDAPDPTGHDVSVVFTPTLAQLSAFLVPDGTTRPLDVLAILAAQESELWDGTAGRQYRYASDNLLNAHKLSSGAFPGIAPVYLYSAYRHLQAADQESHRRAQRGLAPPVPKVELPPREGDTRGGRVMPPMLDAPCPFCDAVAWRGEWRLVVKTAGFSLAGVTPKAVGSWWPFMVCGTCGAEVAAKVDLPPVSILPEADPQ